MSPATRGILRCKYAGKPKTAVERWKQQEIYAEKRAKVKAIKAMAKPKEDSPVDPGPIRRLQKDQEAEKRGQKVTSGRKAAHARILDYEAEEEMGQVLRIGSGTEYLESCPWCAVRGCEGDCRPGKS